MIFRFKVFIPIVLLVALVAWAALYRVDAWLDSAIESSLSALTGTKTDVDGLELSFKKSRLVIKRIQIASRQEEFKNLIELEDLIFDFEFYPLLEKRVVLEDFSIKGIDWWTPRKTSGFLPVSSKKAERSWLSPYIDQAFDRVKQEYKQLPVAKLAEFELPDDVRDVLNRLELESEKALKDSIAKLQLSRSEWGARADDLRDISEYKRYWKEFEALASGVPNDPAKIASRVKSIKNIIDIFETEKNKASDLLGNVRSEYKALKSNYSSAVDAIKKDYARAKALVSIDELNMKNLSKLIFGQQWISRFEMALQYQDLFRQKLALLTESEEAEDVEVKKRALGRDIVFVVQREKPSFVLESAAFKVKGLEKEEAGFLSQTYSLEMADLNSNPRIYGKPSSLNVSALFREAPLAGAQLDMFWDYTKPVPEDRYELKVQKILAKDWPVGIPYIFEVSFKEGLANTHSSLSYKGDDMSLINRVNFSGVKWELPTFANLGFLIRAMYGVLTRIDNFYVEFELRKSRADDETRKLKLDYIVRSDLDSHLNRAIQALIQEELEKFKKKLERAINNQVNKYKRQGQELVEEYNSQLLNEIESKKKQASSYVKKAEAKVKELEDRIKKIAKDRAQAATKKAKEKLQNKAQPALDKLKKALP